MHKDDNHTIFTATTTTTSTTTITSSTTFYLYCFFSIQKLHVFNRFDSISQAEWRILRCFDDVDDFIDDDVDNDDSVMIMSMVMMVR